MNVLNETSLLQSRVVGREAVLSTIPSEVVKSNSQFLNSLQRLIKDHRITCHPIKAALGAGQFNLEAQRRFHLEFGHAFAEVFTDAVVMALFTAGQLESRLGPKAKSAARFLLQINLLDEIGFQPGGDSETGYIGTPLHAHYVQFVETLEQLGVDETTRKQYIPMATSVACRATFQNCFQDHVVLTALLAVAETVFRDYASPWAKSVGTASKVDVSKGYHSIHVEDETGLSIDDGHSEDAWIVFNQAITSDRYEQIEHQVKVWLEVWAQFLDSLISPR